MFLYVSSNHRLANRKSVELSELANETFVGYKPHLNLSNIMLHFCKEAGFNPTVKFRGDDIFTMIGLVSAGLGIALSPKVKINTDRIRKIKISKPYCHIKIGLIWIDEQTLSPSAKLFRDYIIESINDDAS